ncbi:hypothetical protein B0H14DRAFT_3740957 [Mycena olivaceomarginata]|nr:hypothetical protein B0H14DRAFT_3740957 [Mycena olivaceomarginata]
MPPGPQTEVNPNGGRRLPGHDLNAPRTQTEVVACQATIPIPLEPKKEDHSLPGYDLDAPRTQTEPKKRIFSLAQRAYSAAPDVHPSGPRIHPPNTNPVNPAQISAFPPTATLSPSRHLDPSDICANPRRTAEESLRPKRPRGKATITASIYRPHAIDSPETTLRSIYKLPFTKASCARQLRRHGSRTGLVRFTEFCDSRAIPEESRMPAHRDILAGFVASWIGNIGGKAIRNWLLGLRQWHLINDAQWHGDEGWLTTLKKAGDRAGDPFKRPPRGPITKQHIRALRCSLDLKTGRGAAIWSTATSCFSGCRRLGELLVVSTARFSLRHDTCSETRILHGVVNGHRVLTFHIVWTKTTTIAGAECVLTEIIGEDADLCPTRAFLNHLEINHSPPIHTPLFVFRENGRWHTSMSHHLPLGLASESSGEEEPSSNNSDDSDEFNPPAAAGLEPPRRPGSIRLG